MEGGGGSGGGIGGGLVVVMARVEEAEEAEAGIGEVVARVVAVPVVVVWAAVALVEVAVAAVAEMKHLVRQQPAQVSPQTSESRSQLKLRERSSQLLVPHVRSEHGGGDGGGWVGGSGGGRGWVGRRRVWRWEDWRRW